MTDVGRRLLSDNPGGISEHTLKALPAYQAHEPVGRQAIDALAASGDDTDLDPTEQMDAGARRIRATVAAELLRLLREQDPAFLEQSVLDVLVAMGYGGVDQRARRIGGSGDGGVDGVIDQDALGLARIYVQAKRYAADNLIGRPTIQGFVGALQGHQSTQGIFITTSSFSREAADYAARVSASVILIDGERLAELMIAYGVGVQVVKTFVAVEVDDNYFE